MWQWGYNTSEKDGAVDCVQYRESNKKPVKYVWFEQQGIKILDLRVGGDFAVVKCEEPDDSLAFYRIASDVDN